MCYMNVSYDKEQRANERGARDRELDGKKKKRKRGRLLFFAISLPQRLNLARSL